MCVQASFSKGYKPERAELASILRAGGATVLTHAQALTQGADLAVLLPGKPRSDPQVLWALTVRRPSRAPDVHGTHESATSYGREVIAADHRARESNTCFWYIVGAADPVLTLSTTDVAFASPMHTQLTAL